MEPPRFKNLPREGAQSLVSDPVRLYSSSIPEVTISESSRFDSWTPVTASAEKFAHHHHPQYSEESFFQASSSELQPTYDYYSQTQGNHIDANGNENYDQQSNENHVDESLHDYLENHYEEKSFVEYDKEDAIVPELDAYEYYTNEVDIDSPRSKHQKLHPSPAYPKRRRRPKKKQSWFGYFKKLWYRGARVLNPKTVMRRRKLQTDKLSASDRGDLYGDRISTGLAARQDEDLSGPVGIQNL